MEEHSCWTRNLRREQGKSARPLPRSPPLEQSLWARCCCPGLGEERIGLHDFGIARRAHEHPARRVWVCALCWSDREPIPQRGNLRSVLPRRLPRGLSKGLRKNRFAGSASSGVFQG